MASSAIFLTIILPTIIACTSGFRIENPQALKKFPEGPGFPTSRAHPAPEPPADYRNQPIAGYPKVPPPNAHLSGGSEDDLLPPLEDTGIGSQYFRRSIEDVKVDPKTGYPLVAEQSWKYAGGNEENLELPLQESVQAGAEEAVDPKTGYPLLAQPHWKDAGGDGDIIALPLEDTEENFGQKEEAVDQKTGYPLKANPSWKNAGGDEGILELPLEDSAKRSDEKAVDPKTGYPLQAEEGWKHAGGDGEILELPLEESSTPVDPKTGYPLTAEPGWRHAGGDGDILELPLESSDEKPEETEVDPKTGYPLKANPSWRDAGGDETILELPLEDSEQTAVDPKTGYPLTAQPSWKDAGGNGDILQLPVDETPTEQAVDPKTGYPLVAQPDWKHAGGDGDILAVPLEHPHQNSAQSRSGQDEYHVFEIIKLTELQPPPLEKNSPTVFSNSFSTPSPADAKQGFFSAGPNGGQFQKSNSFGGHTRFGFGRPIESSYSYTGPENLVVTVTRFLNNQSPADQYDGFSQNGFNQNRQLRDSFTNFHSIQRPVSFHGSSGVPIHFIEPVILQPIHHNLNKRHS